MNHETEALFLSRIVDRTASQADFDALTRIAGEDPGVWERLGLTLRDDVALRGAVGAVLEQVATRPPPRPARLLPGREFFARSAIGLLGLALTFAAGWLSAPRVPQVGPAQGASSSGAASPTDPRTMTARSGDELLDAYLAAGSHSGRVVEQLRPVTLSLRPSQDGKSVEVLFIRQLVERTVVDQVVRFGADELGQVQPAVVRPANCRSPSSL